MAAIRFARFHVESTDADAMISKRAALFDAIRHRFPGLVHAHLTRLDERTWIDICGGSRTPTCNAHSRPDPTFAEAPAVFALTPDLSTEDVELVDER
jgi:hypothetical protein